MMLTFLNLVVVRGVLVGLIQSSTNTYKARYIGDVFISTPLKKNYIENSPNIISIVQNLPWLEAYSARYTQAGKIEGTYKDRINYTDKANEANAIISGIDPIKENSTTHLSDKIIEGSFITPQDTDSVVLGAYLLKKYFPVESSSFSTLENVSVGSKIRITVNGNAKEVTVKGILRSKVDDLDMRVYMLDSTLRGLIGRTDYNVNEIAIKLKEGTDPIIVKEALIKSGAGQTARVQTFEEGLPKFIKDMTATFALLGNVIGSIGLVVASITIFIVIYINAITRRKFIGILKGVGIESLSIESSYIMQSIFYAVIGILVALTFLYGFLVPYVNAHPINFPFSDGVIIAEIPNTMVRALLLLVATVIAGFIPARLVVKQNTLDAILGR